MPAADPGSSRESISLAVNNLSYRLFATRADIVILMGVRGNATVATDEAQEGEEEHAGASISTDGTSIQWQAVCGLPCDVQEGNVLAMRPSRMLHQR